MIHKKIEKLIPFIEEEFITYPLWEEGKYVPFINFWQKFENPKNAENFEIKISKFRELGYDFELNTRIKISNIYIYEFYPNFKDLEDGSYEFHNPKWSIEEMLDILISLIS